MAAPSEGRRETATQYDLRVFEYLIENAFDMLQVLDHDGRVQFASHSSVRVLGLSPREAVRRDAFDGVHAEDRAAARGAFERILASPGHTTEPLILRVRHADGTWRVFASVFQHLVDDGGASTLVVNYQDVTGETAALSELRKLKDRYEKAFRNSPSAITMSYVDDGRFLEVNEGFAALTGYSPSEIIGVSSLEIGLWKNPEDRRRAILEVSRSGRVSDLEVELAIKNGETRVALFSAEVVEMGGKPCLLAVAQDITEMKEANEKLRRTSEQLRREQEALTRKNAALREILQHLEQEKEAFRHELSANVENLLRPIVERLRQAGGELRSRDVDLLSGGLDSIVGRNIDQYRNNLLKLTPRELDVCDLIGEGRTSKEIAETLGLSDQTVHKHRQSIRRKLQIDNRGINLAAYLRSH